MKLPNSFLGKVINGLLIVDKPWIFIPRWIRPSSERNQNLGFGIRLFDPVKNPTIEPVIQIRFRATWCHGEWLAVQLCKCIHHMRTQTCINILRKKLSISRPKDKRWIPIIFNFLFGLLILGPCEILLGKTFHSQNFLYHSKSSSPESSPVRKVADDLLVHLCSCQGTREGGTGDGSETWPCVTLDSIWPVTRIDAGVIVQTVCASEHKRLQNT